MRYVIVQFADGTQAYRECDPSGAILRYTDADGVTLPRTDTPVEVIDSDPEFPSWGLPDPVPEPPPEPEPVVRRLTKLQFIQRFTDVEFATILAAVRQDVQIEAWYEQFRLATPDPDGTSVDLDDPRTQGGVMALEAFGLIGSGRAAEILG